MDERETILLPKSIYDLLPKFTSRDLAEEAIEAGTLSASKRYIFTCGADQEVLVKGGVEYLVEIKKNKPTRAEERRRRLREHGEASLEARYNLDFPAGLGRAGKRMYVAGLKKAMKKKVKPDSPEYWAIMKNYGFVPSEKKVDNG